jgi:glutathione S-transferase
MRLYVCYGFLKDVVHTPRPGGHPCAKALRALREAGHDPEVVAVGGLGIPPLNRLGRRDEVAEVSGQRMVPVLVTDDGQAVNESKRIIDWARAHPAT